MIDRLVVLNRGKARTKGVAQIVVATKRQGRAAAVHRAAKPLGL
jgi:hypothetical protein